MNLYCDRCGAMAKSRFLFPTGLDLVFCGHHAHEYALVLDENHAIEDVEFNSNNTELIGV